MTGEGKVKVKCKYYRTHLMSFDKYGNLTHCSKPKFDCMSRFKRFVTSGCEICKDPFEIDWIRYILNKEHLEDI